MSIPSYVIVITIVILFALYLIYNQSKNEKISIKYNQRKIECPACPVYQHHPVQNEPMYRYQQNQPTVIINNESDTYADQIKKLDSYTMNDPLSYPQLRLPRDVLEKYNEYYDKNGIYPPFNQNTQSKLFDNPQMVGILIKLVDENEAFTDNVPNSVPLFRVKSSKNANRYFYYIIDQKYLSKIEQKIPLDSVKINGVKQTNGDFYGLPELYDDDILENIPIFPYTKFKVTMYKSYHFP